MTEQELHRIVVKAILSHGSLSKAAMATKVNTSTLFQWKEGLPKQIPAMLSILHAAGLTIKIVPYGKMVDTDSW